MKILALLFILIGAGSFFFGETVSAILLLAVGSGLLAFSLQKKNGTKKPTGILSKFLIAAVLVIGVLFVIAGLFSRINPDDNKDGEIYGPGDTVKINGVSITFHGVTETRGKDFFVPADDKIFVIADFTVENNGGSQINISSVFGSDAYCDDYLVQESMAAELGDPQGRNNLTGSLDSGRKLRGIIGYELPSQWQRLEIRLKTDWWKGSRADTITFLVEAV